MARTTAAEWVPQPHERATMPGSPANPDHPVPRRIAYGLVSALVGITGGLGNALITANLVNLQGALGLYSDEIAWLPTVYVMTTVCINMLLIKFRQQYGLRLFAQIFLVGYVVATGAHLVAHSFTSAIIVRALSGMTAAALSTLGLLYMMQAFPLRHRLSGIVLAVGIPQLAIPLARLFSSDVLEADQWRTSYILELGLALLSLAAVRLLALPPSERTKVFEPLDFVTFALFATGVGLLCAVLGLGRFVWWTQAPWLGLALIGALVLIPAALTIEAYRRNPLLNMRWLGSADMLRFALVAIMVRVVLQEQNVGAVGLMQAVGLGNDELQGLFLVILAATFAGMIVSALTIDPLFLGLPILVALLLIALAAGIDSFSTNLTRPHDLYFSQALLGFAGALFIGPALLVGLTRALQQGPTHFVSFSVLYGITQNLGGLLGSALLGTFQVVRERIHSQDIAAQLTAANPLVAARIQSGGGAYARVLGDPSLRGAEGVASLAAAVTREANILAYNDTFRLFAAIALGTAIWASFHVFRIRRENLARAAAVGS